MSGNMNPAEFANIARSERDFWWYRGMREILWRIMEPHLDGRRMNRVLEAGCGTGYYSYLLQTGHKWPVIPLDLGWEGLSYARKMGVERPVQGDIAALPFPSACFDAVLSLDVIVHFPRGEETTATAELSRVLVPGGLLVLRVSALDFLRSRHSQFALERQRFTRARLVRAVEYTGMRVLRVTYANTLLMPVALAKFRLVEPLLRKPPSSGVELVSPWLDRLLYLPLAIEARWIGSGGNLPLGQSLILVAQKGAA
jgi:SAM-dependent methyltransferase